MFDPLPAEANLKQSQLEDDQPNNNTSNIPQDIHAQDSDQALSFAADKQDNASNEDGDGFTGAGLAPTTFMAT